MYHLDRFGNVIDEPDTTGMMNPVRCRCGQVYDLCAVTVLARYSDCTVFTTPCCRRRADDRPWKGSPDFTKIGR